MKTLVFLFLVVMLSTTAFAQEIELEATPFFQNDVSTTPFTPNGSVWSCTGRSEVDVAYTRCDNNLPTNHPLWRRYCYEPFANDGSIRTFRFEIEPSNDTNIDKLIFNLCITGMPNTYAKATHTRIE